MYVLSQAASAMNPFTLDTRTIGRPTDRPLLMTPSVQTVPLRLTRPASPFASVRNPMANMEPIGDLNQQPVYMIPGDEYRALTAQNRTGPLLQNRPSTYLQTPPLSSTQLINTPETLIIV